MTLSTMAKNGFTKIQEIVEEAAQQMPDKVYKDLMDTLGKIHNEQQKGNGENSIILTAGTGEQGSWTFTPSNTSIQIPQQPIMQTYEGRESHAREEAANALEERTRDNELWLRLVGSHVVGAYKAACLVNEAASVVRNSLYVRYANDFCRRGGVEGHWRGQISYDNLCPGWWWRGYGVNLFITH